METVNKITLEQLGNMKDWEEAVIVFTAESFDYKYTETERSYKVASNAKWFNPNMIGMSLIGDCLDGQDNGVRLDKYMRLLPNEGNKWKVEYCYIIK
jgi:hypothetical protein